VYIEGASAVVIGTNSGGLALGLGLASGPVPAFGLGLALGFGLELGPAPGFSAALAAFGV
jgi:hypothetical protein